MNAETFAQLTGELRTAARGQTAIRRPNWQDLVAADELLSAFMRLNIQDPAGDLAARQSLTEAVTKVRQQAELAARERQDKLRREKDAQKMAQLAALSAQIAALSIAIQKALLMADLVTAAILAAILLVLQIEFASIAAAS